VLKTWKSDSFQLKAKVNNKNNKILKKVVPQLSKLKIGPLQSLSKQPNKVKPN